MLYKSIFTSQIRNGIKLKPSFKNYSVIASVLGKANVGEITEVKVCVYLEITSKLNFCFEFNCISNITLSFRDGLRTYESRRT